VACRSATRSTPFFFNPKIGTTFVSSVDIASVRVLYINLPGGAMTALLSLIHFVIAVWLLVDMPRWVENNFGVFGEIYLWSAASCVSIIALENLVLPFFQNSPISGTLNGFFKSIFLMRKIHAYLHSLISLGLVGVPVAAFVYLQFIEGDNITSSDLEEMLILTFIGITGLLVWRFFTHSYMDSKEKL
jgi:hypothetical protein